MISDDHGADINVASTPEHKRLAAETNREGNWKRWGPYLSERQWGTVREDYSADGNAWRYFPFDHSHLRAYRWGEDGLMGICDRQARLCFALALWNGRDPILKERLFGLANGEGPHGEDVKEAYWYLDALPTSSYLRALYKYPQCEFPYAKLRSENATRSPKEREFELWDTGAFDEERYFDVFTEYAKAGPEDILIRVAVVNRGPEAARIDVLPTLWFRNTWSWKEDAERPFVRALGPGTIEASHTSLGDFRLILEKEAPLLFTENETNIAALYGAANPQPFVKDAFHRAVVHGQKDAVNPEMTGTKCAVHYALEVPAGGEVVLRFRLGGTLDMATSSFEDFENTLADRRKDARLYLATKAAAGLDPEKRNVLRQAYASLLWSKQFYHYDVKTWLTGDPAQPPPPPGHARKRNADWAHLYNGDVISMPDKWEYPWYAAWDLAFHMIPMSRVDPDFAKQQLMLFLREWYLRPDGALPAYEWNFSDVNPPVHAWACWRVYKITAHRGQRDTLFLERCFQKLLLNFTWWVNRKDARGQHLFGGGFLGMDNIGLFDRSKALPSGKTLEQADGTAWMAFYCVTMLSMSLELARTRPAYEDIASKFFEHFVSIADAMNTLGGTGLWDEDDGFYYDRLRDEGGSVPLRARSMVGLIPLLAVEVLEQDLIKSLPGFRKRMRWFLENRPELGRQVSYMERAQTEGGEVRLLAIPRKERLVRVLQRMLDEEEFLGPYGIRSLSRAHREETFCMLHEGGHVCVQYEPGESTDGMWGGNSNWRGPVWFPLNYLLVEALERYHRFYGDSLKVEYPTGSGVMLPLDKVAARIARRLTRIFLPDEKGARPCHRDDALSGKLATHPNWKELVWFHEYFDGDTGRGLGASHQTGWTALVARCLNLVGRREDL
jgi:glycogen debranching enzyme